MLGGATTLLVLPPQPNFIYPPKNTIPTAVGVSKINFYFWVVWLWPKFLFWLFENIMLCVWHFLLSLKNPRRIFFSYLFVKSRQKTEMYYQHCKMNNNCRRWIQADLRTFSQDRCTSDLLNWRIQSPPWTISRNGRIWRISTKVHFRSKIFFTQKQVWRCEYLLVCTPSWG